MTIRTSPGDMVPPFEQAMNTLQPGQVSDVVATPFGWHLIHSLTAELRYARVDDSNRLQFILS